MISKAKEEKLEIVRLYIRYKNNLMYAGMITINSDIRKALNVAEKYSKHKFNITKDFNGDVILEVF